MNTSEVIEHGVKKGDSTIGKNVMVYANAMICEYFYVPDEETVVVNPYYTL